MCGEGRLETGVGCLLQGVVNIGNPDEPLEQPHSDTVLRGPLSLPNSCCFQKCGTLDSDFVVASVLHSEFCFFRTVSGSQHWNVQFCLLTKMQPKNVLIQLLTLYLYTSFPELGSFEILNWVYRNPWLSLEFVKSVVWGNHVRPMHSRISKYLQLYIQKCCNEELVSKINSHYGCYKEQST